MLVPSRAPPPDGEAQIDKLLVFMVN